MACTNTLPAPLQPGFYIQYSDHTQDEHGNAYTLVYGWDADQCTFTRLEPWWTRYATRARAEEEHAARDMARWHTVRGFARTKRSA